MSHPAAFAPGRRGAAGRCVTGNFLPKSNASRPHRSTYGLHQNAISMPFESTQLRFLCGLAMFNRRCFLGAMHFIESLTAAYCPPRQMAQREPAKLLEQVSISLYAPLLGDSASIIPAKQRHFTRPICQRPTFGHLASTMPRPLIRLQLFLHIHKPST